MVMKKQYIFLTLTIGALVPFLSTSVFAAMNGNMSDATQAGQINVSTINITNFQQATTPTPVTVPEQAPAPPPAVQVQEPQTPAPIQEPKLEPKNARH
ncbi:MAG: hypothetical protein FDX30_10190 [Chlorobium sp.]|nr:MAG: hypothetical protein FDX30_10190 [Chlorobium sp.]